MILEYRNDDHEYEIRKIIKLLAKYHNIFDNIKDQHLTKIDKNLLQFLKF